jgi:hypothetical protein
MKLEQPSFLCLLELGENLYQDPTKLKALSFQDTQKGREHPPMGQE